MSYKISKELFESVMGFCKNEVAEMYVSDENIFWHTYEDEFIGNKDSKINVDTFFFKCKEWAIKENRENKIINNGDHFYINHIGSWMIGYFENYQCDVGYRGKNKDETFADLTKHFTADSEQQAVFDACMYILDKDKQ